MPWTRNAWNNFKTQPEIWFFYGFLLTSCFSVRKVFFNYPILGAFNEYSGFYLYLSDIFLGLAIAAWVILILYNKQYELSINKFLAVPRGTFIPYLALPAILVLWSFITIFWSDQPQIALYRSFRLFEFYLLYLFLALNPKCSTWNILRNVFRIIIGIGLINAITGILQAIIQHSLGLFWLKESLISPDLPGVAKIVLDGAKYIRAYGLFPHPNILGGFLLMSIIMTWIYRKLFHSGQNVLPQYECSTWNILRGRHGTIWKMLHLLQVIGLVTTFSKSALMGLALALVYLIYIKKVPRETASQSILEKKGLFKAYRYWVVFVTGLIFCVLALIFRPDLNSLLFQSLNERVLYLDIARKMILTNPLFGVGVGQFVVNMQAYTNQLLLDWQFQPVHNVFLLIWSELGLVGLGLFIWFLWKMLHPSQNVPQGTSNGAGVKQAKASFKSKNVPCGTFRSKSSIQSVFTALLIGFFVIALFDHYLWDVQQGQIMLWLALGLLASRESSI